MNQDPLTFRASQVEMSSRGPIHVNIDSYVKNRVESFPRARIAIFQLYDGLHAKFIRKY